MPVSAFLHCTPFLLQPLQFHVAYDSHYVKLDFVPHCFIGVVICLERGADLHMAQWIPLPLTISCFSKIQIGFTFLVPAHPGSPGQRAIKWVCVCVCVCGFINGVFCSL